MHCAPNFGILAPFPSLLLLQAQEKGAGRNRAVEAKTQAEKSRAGSIYFNFFPEVPCRVRALVPSQQTARLSVQVRVADFGKAPGGGNSRACPELSIPTPMKLGHMARLSQGSEVCHG